MNRLNKAQKDRITQFRTVTGASEKVAADCLKATGWGLEASLDHFYSSGIAATVVPPVDTRGAEQLFNKYKDPSLDNMISAEGVSQFCEDLGVDPTDVVMLVISQYMNAEVMGEYSRDEFMGGLQRMGCDSLEKLKKKVPDLRAELKREDRFREVYNYTYMFGREKGQKCVQQDTAIGLWSLLLGDSERPRWALTADWCEFLQKHHNRAISKDTWVQLYDFIMTVSPDFSNFDESAAWPVLIDEFVDFMKAKRGQ